MRRGHELDLHRPRQTEYRTHLRLHYSNHTSQLIAPSQRPHAGRRSQRTRLFQSLPFFTPLSYRSRQAAPLPCKLAVLASRTTRDRQGRRSRRCAPSIVAHAPASLSFIVFATSTTTGTNVHCVWRAITICRFTTRSALGATMRCVRPSHWFVLSLTLTCRPFTGQRISPQLRKPRRPWQDHARTPRHHRRHHSD